mgnify:CR=1 FL=1
MEAQDNMIKDLIAQIQLQKKEGNELIQQNLSLTDQILGLADKSFSSKEITEEYINESKLNFSIQMAARELRYNWFRELLFDTNFILTAHHLDDSLEYEANIDKILREGGDNPIK